jgi:hypothetical protein
MNLLAAVEDDEKERPGPSPAQATPTTETNEARRSPDLAGRWGEMKALKELYNLYYSGPRHGRHERG